jgi:hypothetical protein
MVRSLTASGSFQIMRRPVKRQPFFSCIRITSPGKSIIESVPLLLRGMSITCTAVTRPGMVIRPSSFTTNP